MFFRRSCVEEQMNSLLVVSCSRLTVSNHRAALAVDSVYNTSYRRHHIIAHFQLQEVSTRHDNNQIIVILYTSKVLYDPNYYRFPA